MLRNQLSNYTKYNRYPEIFKEIKDIINEPDKILSFGCSTGKECNTLSDLYFPNSKIVGLDLKEDIIKDNILNNKNQNIEYFNNIDDLKIKYDKFKLIFAMSVLCGNNFKLFNNTVKYIDDLLEEDGYLCIYNAKYLFEEADVFKEKYKIVETNYKDSGFNKKYDKSNNLIENYPYILFKKNNDITIQKFSNLE